jgi:hypothetical protein
LDERVAADGLPVIELVERLADGGGPVVQPPRDTGPPPVEGANVPRQRITDGTFEVIESRVGRAGVHGREGRRSVHLSPPLQRSGHSPSG